MQYRSKATGRMVSKRYAITHPKQVEETRMNALEKDFTPTKETISLHGLGFIQLVLDGNQRMHVWHPDLPRRKCYEHSAIHNHRFSFTSVVLKGIQQNVRCDLEIVRPGTGTHDLISHNGPRSVTGGRISYPVADVNVVRNGLEKIGPGEQYYMEKYAYHYTPCDGIVVTLMKKHEEGDIHANSVCKKDVTFDYAFDRFQLSPDKLFGYVVEALK